MIRNKPKDIRCALRRIGIQPGQETAIANALSPLFDQNNDGGFVPRPGTTGDFRTNAINLRRQLFPARTDPLLEAAPVDPSISHEVSAGRDVVDISKLSPEEKIAFANARSKPKGVR